MQPPESVPLTAGAPRRDNHSEIYLENNRLRERLGAYSRSQEELEGTDTRDERSAGRRDTSRKRKIQRWRCLAIVAMILLVFCLGSVAAVAAMFIFISSGPAESVQLLTPRSSRLESLPAGFVGKVGLQKQVPLGALNWKDSVGDAIGIRSDYLLQNCQGPSLKRTFPDIDYALLGYNVLKGYPLAVGHDPGFTLPIFAADYSAGSMTADCRYNVPQGIILIPDVSCVTSFSSQVVKTSYELSRSLQVSASVTGGGWGVSFSASAGYKQSSSQMSTGESVFIISRANCNYYYMKLLEDEAPPFHPVFLKWIIKLNNTDNETVYTDFFDKYGTHFLAGVRFGASFTYEHTMSAQSFKQFTESGVNVGVAASYSGSFSVGGGFNMEASAKEAASKFQQQVTTRTITVGAAPPANGDTMTWASTVQESPVPVTYDLRSIEDLFSETFMGQGDTERFKVNFRHIQQTIRKHKKSYCERLNKQGLLDGCDEMSPGLIMKNTELSGSYYKKVTVSSFEKCIDECYKRDSCVAADFCTGCTSKNGYYDTCHLYKETKLGYGIANDKYQSIVVLTALEKQIVLKSTAVNGVTRSLTNATGVDTEKECFDQCLQDVFCFAFTFCQCTDQQQCTLYSTPLRLVQKDGTSTHFISHRVNSVHDVYTTGDPGRAGR